MKKLIVAAAAAGLSMLFSVTPFAAGWELGTGDHASQWKYVNADNTLDTGWHVIDGNGDGIAEWYYFDNEGWLLTSTTTPDGYTVNENGAWVQNGQVVTEKVGGAQAGTAAQTAETGTQTAESDAKADAASRMQKGRYFMYNVVTNGVTQKLSMNVLYQSFYEFASVTDKSVILLHTVTDTYGVSTQMYVTFDKQSDGTYKAKVNDGYTLLQMNPEEKWIYVGEPDFSRGHIYLLESEL